jgi:hypothetical protein
MAEMENLEESGPLTVGEPDPRTVRGLALSIGMLAGIGSAAAFAVERPFTGAVTASLALYEARLAYKSWQQIAAEVPESSV